MRKTNLLLGDHTIKVFRAESGKERRRGMRIFTSPRPLLLSAAPLIHTRGCPSLDLVWIYREKVARLVRARPNRIYIGPGWLCLELPAGLANELSIKKGDPVFVLDES